MNKSFTFLMLFSVHILLAQIPVLYNHTPNGEVVLGQYHNYLQGEYGGLNIQLEDEFESYEKGTYLLKSEPIKEKGYLKFYPNKITHRLEFLKARTILKKITAEKIDYLKLGIDSFFVVNKIKNKEKIIEKSVLVQHIASFSELDYALYYEYYKLNGTLKEKFIISKKNDSNIWERVVLKGEPKRKFIMLFPEVEKYIDKKELSIDEFLNSVKTRQHNSRFKNKTRFWFNKNWDELETEKEAAYIANVISKQDSIFTISLSNLKEEILYQVPISSFNPNKKTGKMKIFSEEKLQQERIYSNDSLKKVTYFTIDNKIKLQYENIIYRGKKNKKHLKKSYVKILENNGDYNELNEKNTIQVDYGNLTIYHDFENKEISKTYSITDKGNKVFFYTEKDNPLDLSRLKTEVKVFLANNVEFEVARLKQNLEGVVLLDVKTDYKGRIVSYAILNSMENKMDEFFEQFCKLKLSENSIFRFKFKGIKLDDKHDLCRFVVPISFEHKRFYKTFSRPNYNGFHNAIFFQQQLQWQQQQLKARIPSSGF